MLKLCTNTSGRINLASARCGAVSWKRRVQARVGSTGIEAPVDTPSRNLVQNIDPYVAATARVKSLLSGVGDGEDELLDMELAQEGANKKLAATAALGAAVMLLSVLVVKLCDNDILGGATLSVASLEHAVEGALLSLPLVVLHWYTWQQSAHALFPVMADIHKGLLPKVAPWLSGMTRPQAALYMLLEVLPLTVLTFPATEGALRSGINLYSELVGSVGLDIAVPEDMATGASVLLVSLAAGMFRSMDLTPEAQQVEVLETAADNADRYYQVMATNGATDPQTSARAFKAVVQAYLNVQEQAADAAGIIGFVDVFAMGSMWAFTHDLSTVLVASLCFNWVDYYYRHDAVMKKATKASKHDALKSSD